MFTSKISAFSLWLTYSLKARLMCSAILMIIVMLPIIAITLSNAFNDQLHSALKNELRAYSYSIFAVAEVEDQTLVMPEQLLENQFNVIQSGLYAKITAFSPEDLASSVSNELQVQHVKKALWQSGSLLGVAVKSALPHPNVGDTVFTEIFIDNQPHIVYSISVSFSESKQSFPVTLHIFKNQAEFLAITKGFKQQLYTWLMVLMIVFTIAMFIWLKWTLKPLNTLTHELKKVEQGKKNALEENYPLELQQVTAQLNTLLSTEQNQRKRYRNALSDLAHSLKTPLAVIQSQQNLSTDTKEQITTISHMVEHQLKRAQTAGESAWHLGVSIDNIAHKLISTLDKIYQEKQLNISANIQKNAIFKGDEADLMEILGNLLDNACKAANAEVALNISFNAQVLRISVADDGEGIEEFQRDVILKRGTRADTYEKGHGIGLAIVRDLVSSYNGELFIQRSSVLGGALFLLTFKRVN